MPVPEAFQKLATYRFHAIPVVKDGKPVSFLDLTDIVRHLFAAFSDEELQNNKFTQVLEWHGEYIRVLKPKQKMWDIDDRELPDSGKVQHFRSKTVGEVAKQPFVSLQENSTLFDAVTTMLSKSTHRVALESASGQLTGILTQMDVMKFLHKHLPTEFSQLKLSDIEMGSPDVLKVGLLATTLEAFRLIEKERVTGVAVVDSEGKFVGNLSASDLKVILYDAAEYITLHLPVTKYLEKMKQKDANVPRHGLALKRENSFADLLNAVATNSVYRVFIIDGNSHLQKVITITDVFDAIINHHL